jgi:ATP-binding cassette subfamily C protein CydD
VSLRLLDGQLPFAQALAVLVITPEFFFPLRQLAIRYHAGAGGRAAAGQVFEILDRPSARRDAIEEPGIARVRRVPDNAAIRFQDVWFGYERRESVLRGVSFTIASGSVTAIVGETGAGKSTCCSLLLRFADPAGGKILVGDIPLTALDEQVWRGSVAWVPQRPHLFQGTIADNIRLARRDAPFEAIERAARHASAASFIEALPLGYDTPIGDNGLRLSGGQRQRIAIARAFLKDTPYVILDEPTSHLDPTSEAIVGEAIGRLSRTRTVLLITHRVALAASALMVYTFANGAMTPTTMGSPVSGDRLHTRRLDLLEVAT